MAYITATEVDIKRRALKEAFPGWKFSVRKNAHSSTIQVGILEAPVDFMSDDAIEIGSMSAWSMQDRARGYIDVNVYHYQRHFRGEALEKLIELDGIINANNHDNSDVMTDYFDVGFYRSIEIGTYQKPFVFKPGVPSPVKKAA